MRILIQTAFHPNIGGIETISALLADEWTAAGEEITVCTDVARELTRTRDFPFPVHHRPAARELFTLVRRSDVVVQMNVSLKMIWPVPILRAKLVAVHHGCYFASREGGRG